MTDKNKKTIFKSDPLCVCGKRLLLKKKHSHDSQLDSIYKVKLSQSKETSGSDSKAF